MTTKIERHLPPVKIIGGGALGSLFAAFLEPHSDIAMLTHWAEQIAAIRSRGLICLHGDGVSSKHDIFVTNSPLDLAPIQLGLVLVKSYQTARAAYELAPVLAPDGVVITLQNGLGNLEALEAALGRGRVVQGVTAQGATMVGAGEVRHAGHGPTTIATSPTRTPVLEDFVGLLNQAGLAAQLSDDVTALQWGKLGVNAGINPLTAVLRVPNGFLAENEAANSVMCAAAEETAAVARQLGITLPYSDAAARVTEVAEKTAGNFSSMLQDVLRGAPTEIDAINGAVANYGRQSGVPTPLNDELWRQVKAVQAALQTGAVFDAEASFEKLLNSVC